MELLISSLTAAMELTESLMLETQFWLSAFSSHTFLIFSVMESRELMVFVELWTLLWEAFFILSTKLLMFLVICWVSSESSRISLATTENPFPTSPTLAASTEAFSASRFVWREMESIPEMTSAM